MNAVIRQFRYFANCGTATLLHDVTLLYVDAYFFCKLCIPHSVITRRQRGMLFASSK